MLVAGWCKAGFFDVRAYTRAVGRDGSRSAGCCCYYDDR